MDEDLGGKQPPREALPDCSRPSQASPGTLWLCYTESANKRTGLDKAVLRTDRSLLTSGCDLSIAHVLNRGDSAQNGNRSPCPPKQVS